MIATSSQRHTLHLADKSLLRGCVVSVLFYAFGHHLRSSPGQHTVILDGESTFEESCPVRAIDSFISHSWHSRWYDKYFTLLLHFNCAPAVALSMCMSLACSVLFTLLEGPKNWFGSWVRVIGLGIAITTHVVVLFFWQRVLVVLRRSKYVFFDKVCIHQSNMDLKAQGIANIAGMIAHSKELLIALDTFYFTRLWCPFEVAAFTKAHPQGSIVALPVQIGRIAMCSSLSGCATMILTHFIIDIRGGTHGTSLFIIVLLCALTMCIPLAWLADGYFKNLAELKNKLKIYSVRQAECFCCKNGHIHPDTGATIVCDREIVYNSIAEWHGSGDLDCGLHSFDSLVRNMWKDTITNKLGTVCMPYSFLLLPGMWHVMADLAFAGMHRTTLDKWQLVYASDVFFLRLPLSTAAVFILTEKFHTSMGAVPLWNFRISVIGSVGASFSWISTYVILQQRLDTVHLIAWMGVEACLLLVFYRNKFPWRRTTNQTPKASIEMQAA